MEYAVSASNLLGSRKDIKNRIIVKESISATFEDYIDATSKKILK